MGDRVVQELLAEVEREKQREREEKRAGMEVDEEEKEEDCMGGGPAHREAGEEEETLDEAHKWMTEIDKFEQRHLSLPLEYRFIGDLMNRLKETTEKRGRFILLQKLNRAVRLMECKEAYDPNNPANFGVILHQQVGSPDDLVDNAGFEKQMIQGASLEEADEDFSETKKKDDLLLEKLNAIEKRIEEMLAELDYTFGKKGRVLEEE
ncbi:hypothetical protein COCNU_10G008140 [Cocos nucifera]|uniref:Uncharacterized protein n=1 Tax=Cocos nucifera TaxID=13894 RepID=A0A8K0IM72_COCNU|nr:hypothetical protein COCNU_10G008140 [Cocos nucifera]